MVTCDQQKNVLPGQNVLLWIFLEFRYLIWRFPELNRLLVGNGLISLNIELKQDNCTVCCSHTDVSRYGTQKRHSKMALNCGSQLWHYYGTQVGHLITAFNWELNYGTQWWHSSTELIYGIQLMLSIMAPNYCIQLWHSVTAPNYCTQLWHSITALKYGNQLQLSFTALN